LSKEWWVLALKYIDLLKNLVTAEAEADLVKWMMILSCTVGSQIILAIVNRHPSGPGILGTLQ
jgi:hypothetical protein